MSGSRVSRSTDADCSTTSAGAESVDGYHARQRPLMELPVEPQDTAGCPGPIAVLHEDFDDNPIADENTGVPDLVPSITCASH